MGLRPPYDPFADAALSWAVVRVAAIEPLAPTWSRPATVTLEVIDVLRGDVPSSVPVVFGAPRESGDAYFYVARHLGSPPHTAEQLADAGRRRAELDATPVDVPAVGARIVVWLSPGAPGGGWDIPTLRAMGMATPNAMRSRWLDGDDDTVALVRARLGGPGPPV